MHGQYPQKAQFVMANIKHDIVETAVKRKFGSICLDPPLRCLHLESGGFVQMGEVNITSYDIIYTGWTFTS